MSDTKVIDHLHPEMPQVDIYAVKRVLDIGRLLRSVLTEAELLEFVEFMHGKRLSWSLHDCHIDDCSKDLPECADSREGELIANKCTRGC